MVVCVLWFVFASCGFLARFGCGAFWFMTLLFLVVAWCFDLVLLGALVFVAGHRFCCLFGWFLGAVLPCGVWCLCWCWTLLHCGFGV